MADPKRRRAENVPGDFFVDETCIDCGTCRWMAPDVYDAQGGASRVHAQPTDDGAALRALVACPTGSIGVRPRRSLKAAIRAFPYAVAPGIYHCGYHAESSFGAASWLLVRPQGNVLIDSPRFNAHLLRGIQALGGARHLFLTHRDDVADHALWADALNAQRWLHADDVRPGTRDVENVFVGDTELDGLPILHTPGHTQGSACLLAGTTLFSGDHVAFVGGRLRAFRGACWYSWSVQRDSMRRLASMDIRHVFPGHAAPGPTTPDDWVRLLEWMARPRA